jgi:hypothetical protein
VPTTTTTTVVPTTTTTTVIPTTTTTTVVPTTTTTSTFNPIITPTCINVSNEVGIGYTGTFTPNLGFYRNYEANNTLALAEYTGRIRPIQTAIEFVETNHSYVILRNVPQIDDLYVHPERFGLYNITTLTYPDGNLSGIISVTNLGSYSGNINCVKFFTTVQSSGSVGDKYGIYDIYPVGTWRNNNKIIPLGTGGWNSTYVISSAGIWKKHDGTYAMIANGYNDSAFPSVKQHLFYSTSIIGPWVDQNTTIENLFNSTYLPANYYGVSTVIGCVDLGDGTYAGSTALIDGSGQRPYPSIVMWNEDLTRRGAFNIITDYTFVNTFTSYTSLTFYKGKYYYSLQDGLYNTGKRQVLVSNCLEGTYSYHSTVLDFSDPQFNFNDGLMYHGSFASGRLFTVANRLYFASSGENMNNPLAGEFSNHCIYIWLYDDNSNTWSHLVGPVITASHSNTLFPLNWGTDHTGFMDGVFIEDDKFWFTYTLLTTRDTYELTNAYFDLSIVLKISGTTTTTTTVVSSGTTTTTTAVPTTTTTTAVPTTTTTTTISGSTTLKTGLISVWEMEETGGTIAYDSYASNNLIISGATLNQVGKIGKAFSYDGTNYLYSSSRIVTGFPYSISAWIKIGTTSNNLLESNYLITPGNYYGVEVQASSNKLVVRYGSGTGNNSYARTTYQLTVALTTGNWYHVVVTTTAHGVFTYYLNNVVQTIPFVNGTATSTSFDSGNVYIGTEAWPPNDTIDQVAMWNKALTSGEAALLYNSGNGRSSSSW